MCEMSVGIWRVQFIEGHSVENENYFFLIEIVQVGIKSEVSYFQCAAIQVTNLCGF